jgi:hypothetical protein
MATTLDVLKLNNSEELIGLVQQIIPEIPEINYFEASPLKKNSYKIAVQPEVATAVFRKPGNTVPQNAPNLQTVDVNCEFLDGTWTMDEATATQADWGKEMAFAIMTKAKLQAMLLTLARQIWHGTTADTNGFPGLDTIVTQKYGVETGENITSVYAVSTGLETIQIAWGSEGKIVDDDVKKQFVGTKTDGAGYYYQSLTAWAGLQVANPNAAGILNVSPASPLTDEKLYEMMEKMKIQPKAFFMSRKSLSQLRNSRTATNATGAPAPLPTEVEGIPVYVSDVIRTFTVEEQT